MKVYKKTTLVANADGNAFNENLAQVINEMQQANLTVEVLYQTGSFGFSALILAYTEE